MLARYVERCVFPDNGNLIRQLVPYDRLQLEAAALEPDFVFLGYSPRLDGHTSAQPVEPSDPQLQHGELEQDAATSRDTQITSTLRAVVEEYRKKRGAPKAPDSPSS